MELQLQRQRQQMTQETEYQETFADALKKISEGETRAEELEKMLDSLEANLEELLKEVEGSAATENGNKDATTTETGAQGMIR